LGFKPYTCKWAGCKYSTPRRDSALTHVRRSHFHLLPTTNNTNSNEMNGKDTRDPCDYINADTKLVDQVRMIRSGNARGVVRYVCTWEQCAFQGDNFADVNAHIRGEHLSWPVSSEPPTPEH